MKQITTSEAKKLLHDILAEKSKGQNISKPKAH